MFRGKFEFGRNWTILLCRSISEWSEESIFLPIMHVTSRRKENCAKGWIESDARFDPVWDIKVCKTHGRYSVEVEDPFFFEDQTTSWIIIVNGVEKYVREAMPIQEKERASAKPAAKARPILKTSSTSNWNFIPMEQKNGSTLK